MVDDGRGYDNNEEGENKHPSERRWLIPPRFSDPILVPIYLHLRAFYREDIIAYVLPSYLWFKRQLLDLRNLSFRLDYGKHDRSSDMSIARVILLERNFELWWWTL